MLRSRFLPALVGGAGCILESGILQEYKKMTTKCYKWGHSVVSGRQWSNVKIMTLNYTDIYLTYSIYICLSLTY